MLHCACGNKKLQWLVARVDFCRIRCLFARRMSAHAKIKSHLQSVKCPRLANEVILRAGQNKVTMFASGPSSAMCRGVAQGHWRLRDSSKVMSFPFFSLLYIPLPLHGNQGIEIGGEKSTLLGFILSYSH